MISMQQVLRDQSNKIKSLESQINVIKDTPRPMNNQDQRLKGSQGKEAGAILMAKKAALKLLSTVPQ